MRRLLLAPLTTLPVARGQMPVLLGARTADVHAADLHAMQFALAFGGAHLPLLAVEEDS